jgi:hypothetical protein
MSLTVHLLVDSRGWPTALDPEVVNAILQARLRISLDVHAYELGPRWFSHLPAEASAVFLFLTHPLVPGWIDPLREWLDTEHNLWAIYVNDASLSDVREVAALTSGQAIPRAPYRIAQPSPVGLERAVQWIESILSRLLDSAATPPPVKIAPTRWRNLPSNQQDANAYPDQVNLSAHGAASYRLVAASYRGKTHAHNGTFREDAVALATTQYWNIIAVGDGAGTAPMARVGSNLAVTHAVEAMRYAMPEKPSTEDIGRAIWAGLKAAHTAILDFAAEQDVMPSDLHTTLQLLIHWPQPTSCLLGLAHVGDGIIAAETVDGQYYILTEPDTDPEDSGRTLFLTSGPVRQWMERTKVYQFDERLEIVAMMTDGVSGDLEPYAERLPTHLFEPLRQRVLCYPLRQREQALLAFISYDRRGSFDDRTLAVLSRE